MNAQYMKEKIKRIFQKGSFSVCVDVNATMNGFI